MWSLHGHVTVKNQDVLILIEFYFLHDFTKLVQAPVHVTHGDEALCRAGLMVSYFVNDVWEQAASILHARQETAFGGDRSFGSEDVEQSKRWQEERYPAGDSL